MPQTKLFVDNCVEDTLLPYLMQYLMPALRHKLALHVSWLTRNPVWYARLSCVPDEKVCKPLDRHIVQTQQGAECDTIQLQQQQQKQQW